MADIDNGVWDAINELIVLESEGWRETLESIDGPVCAGDPDPEPDPDPADPDPEPDPEPDPKPAKEPDWKTESRKHERRAKEAQKRAADAEAKLREQEEADKTEQEKAIDTARQEASEKARSEVLTELRNERLEVAVARLANGIKIKDGDEEKTVRFADPDDAVVHIERAIKSGDVDQDDIFDSEGKVQTDALTTALEDLLGRKPHLQANGDGRRASGESDAGKGAGGSKSMEDMSVEEHLKRKQESRN